MLIIDTHIHIIVPEITRAVMGDGWCPDVGWADGRQYVEFDGKRISSALREFVDIETILLGQDEAGVDKILLTPWSSLFAYDLDLETSLRFNQIQNDGLAKLVSQYGERVTALGTVPLQDVETAVTELKRCVEELGLPGVEIGTNVNGTYLGDDRFRPFWAAVDSLGALVEIHPVPGVGGPTNREYYLWNAFANPAETALTAAHMILSGLLEAYPALKICLVHGGGHLPYQIGRLDRAYEMRPEAQKKITKPPSHYFKQFYFDTVVHSEKALAYLIDLVGPDQVMLGSDYPFDMGSERPGDTVNKLDITAEAKAKIFGGNAAGLMERK
jgi:aminocarboxymuconate-semialdehyde decarboxylase